MMHDPHCNNASFSIPQLDRAGPTLPTVITCTACICISCQWSVSGQRLRRTLLLLSVFAVSCLPLALPVGATWSVCPMLWREPLLSSHARVLRLVSVESSAVLASVTEILDIDDLFCHLCHLCSRRAKPTLELCAALTIPFCVNSGNVWSAAREQALTKS